VHLVATASATAVLAELPAGSDLLTEICAGKRTATVANDRPGSGQVVRLTGTQQDGRWFVSGTAKLIFAPEPSSVLIAPVRTPDGTALMAITGAELQQHQQIDRTRALGSVDCTEAAATVLAMPGSADVDRALNGGLRRARLLLAAESVGVAAAVLDRTSIYTRQREQFGQPIGTFQAVKHRLADILVAVENARSAAYAAAWAEHDGAAEAELLTSMAKAVAGEAAIFATAGGVQLHGGIAITWEHPMHAYLRRAKSNSALLGKPSWHLERIAAHLLDNQRA
jgi:alkylation response protein AidB-like acyl-CoA dehydrogenase